MLLEKTMPAALVRAMPEIATLARVQVEAKNCHHARAPVGRFAHSLTSAWSRWLAGGCAGRHAERFSAR